MRSWIRKYLGIGAQDNFIQAQILSLSDRISLLESEFQFNDYQRIPIIGGVKEHLWALYQYLDVVPYVEMKKDEQYLPPEPPRHRILKVNKRGKVKHQYELVD